MILKYITRLNHPEALLSIRECLGGLRKDFQLNLDAGKFAAFPGTPLTFEEFLVMLLLDKDFAIRVKEDGRG